MSDAEIPVTPEMIEAARNCGLEGFATTFADIYRAMAAVAPKKRSLDGTRVHEVEAWDNGTLTARIAALEADNAALVAANTRLESERDQFVAHWNKAEQAWAEKMVVCDDLSARISRLEAENVALKLQLIPCVTPPAPNPKAFPATALQPAKSDHRRVGG